MLNIVSLLAEMYIKIPKFNTQGVQTSNLFCHRQTAFLTIAIANNWQGTYFFNYLRWLVRYPWFYNGSAGEEDNFYLLVFFKKPS